MEDIGKELCERVREVFEQRNSSNAFMVRLKDEIARGTATMRDTSLYSQTLGINLRRAIKEVVTSDELPDCTLYYNIAHSILEPLLRDTYEDVNAVCAEVQRKLDDKAGIHLASQKADFPAERVRAACGSASVKDTAEHGIEVLERTSENITAAFSDDYMKANADFRARAGLDTYIERRDDGKCCEWCSKIAGRYSYPDKAPRDIFRRHDNCGCTVEYVSARGRQNVWSKRWASEPKKVPYDKPTVLTKEQAAELEREQSKIKTEKVERIVDRKYINSSEYRRLYDLLGEDSKVTREIYNKCREMLLHRTGTDFEDLAYIDSISGKSMIQKHYNVSKVVEPTERMKKMLRDSQPNTIVGIHNHPDSFVPSTDDLNAAFKRKYKYGLVVCHNGTLFKYSVDREMDSEFTDILLDKLQRVVYNNNKDDLQSVLEELKEFGVTMEVLRNG